MDSPLPAAPPAGHACPSCGHHAFPAADICPACGSIGLERIPMPTHGTLYAFSRVHVGPLAKDGPFVLGYVDLPDGARVFAHIGSPPDSLRHDMRVRLDTSATGLTSPTGEPITYRFIATEEG